MEKLFMHVFRLIEEVTSKSLYDCIIHVIYCFKGLWCYIKGQGMSTTANGQI